MTERSTLPQRLRYRFENTMSKGPISVIAWLAVVTLALILAAGILLSLLRVNIAPGEQVGFVEGIWLSMLRTLDPGTMGGDQGWRFRIVALVVTLGGIFVVSALIGLITTGIDTKLSEIRRGKTLVLERGHTLILGWSPKVFTILAELAIANESESDPSVVILAPHDKVEMEEEIRDRVELRSTRVVCRSGQPSNVHDLGLVNLGGAKAVIVLAPETAASDAQVIKTILALMKIDPGLESSHVVAECNEQRNALALRGATGGRVSIVVSSDLIARITAQVCRQSGLSSVYRDLLDFDGDEIYFVEEAELVGRPFGEALFAYVRCSVIGLRRADGRITLRPAMDATIEPGDKIISIAEDDSTVVWSPVAVPREGIVATRHPGASPSEALLVVGWNRLGPQLLAQLDRYMPQGSRVHVLFDPDGVDARQQPADSSIGALAVTSSTGDTTDAAALTQVLDRGPFDHAVIMCYRHGMGPEEAESRTLLTLVQLRSLIRADARHERHVSIATELLDVRDVDLASVADPDDFIVSESLTSLLLAQLSENAELAGVFDDLFNPHGTEVTLRAASGYLPLGTPLTFAHAVAAARDHGEIAIGYRTTTPNGARPHVEMVVNPSKATQVTFNADDQLLVLS